MQKVMQNPITIYETNPSDFSVRTYDNAELKRIVEYMESFEPFSAAGLVEDCVTGKRLKDENLGYTDGIFVWSTQDIYHVEKYGAALTDAFLSKILTQ